MAMVDEDDIDPALPALRRDPDQGVDDAIALVGAPGACAHEANDAARGEAAANGERASATERRQAKRSVCDGGARAQRRVPDLGSPDPREIADPSADEDALAGGRGHLGPVDAV